MSTTSEDRDFGRPMMTVGEVAKLLNVSKDYVRDSAPASGACAV